MNRDFDMERVYRDFQDRYALLIGIARRYAPAPELVYDVMQQVFVDLVERSRETNLPAQDDLTRFLVRVTKNRAIDLCRQQKRSQALRELGDWMTSRYRETCEAREDAEDVLRHRRELDALKECIESLPEEGRGMIEQHYRQHVSMEEIAKRTGRKPAAVRQVFFRLRVKLRQCIETKNDEITPHR